MNKIVLKTPLKTKIMLEPRGRRIEVEDTHKPNRNANGMLSLFPEADIIAWEANGPMNAEVLPTYHILTSGGDPRR